MKIKTAKANYYRFGVAIPTEETPLTEIMPALLKGQGEKGRKEAEIIAELKRDANITMTEEAEEPIKKAGRPPKQAE